MVQGPQIWGARGPDMGTTSEGHICLYEAVWTLVFGPIISWFYALFGPFWPFLPNGPFWVPDPCFWTYTDFGV